MSSSSSSSSFPSPSLISFEVAERYREVSYHPNLDVTLLIVGALSPQEGILASLMKPRRRIFCMSKINMGSAVKLVILDSSRHNYTVLLDAS
jgi:hypothetical protein